jgi:hypothetical protein
MPCHVGHCTILLKPYISHSLAETLQFQGQIYLQHSVIALIIQASSLVVFLTEVTHDHTFSLWRHFSWIYIGSLSLKYLKLYVYIIRQVTAGLIWQDQKTQKTIIIRKVEESSTEIPMRSFSLFHQSVGYMIFYRWNLESSNNFLWRDLIRICKASMCHLAERTGLRCFTALTHSVFSGVQTEHAGPTNIFTALPWTLKSSTHFNMAYWERILSCLEHQNSHRKHLCICKIDFVSKQVSQQKYNDRLSNSPWLEQYIPRCTCTHNTRLPHSIQLPTAEMWNLSHPCIQPCSMWTVTCSSP